MTGKAVVLIFAHAVEPDERERLSLAQCQRVLGSHPLRLVCPEGLDVAAYRRIAPGLQPDFIPARWLASLRAYNRLKVLPWLYRRYAAFEYMLTYELDAFVFRDELLEWCARGWDYIGAPWFAGYGTCGPDSPPIGVGNSGFSLRKVASVLRVCRTPRYRRPARDVLAAWRAGRQSLWTTVAALTRGNNFLGPLNDFHDHEDLFWGRIVPARFPWFRVAPYEEARRFSFEANPRRLYDECGGRLPFGCHKWWHNDPLFWADHVDAAAAGAPRVRRWAP